MNLFGFSVRDLSLLLLGAILSYLVGLIVADQTDKKKNLLLKLVEKAIILEEGTYCPFTIQDDETKEILDNCYGLIIRLWNEGKIEILSSDISETNPLKISIDSSARVIGNPRGCSSENIVFSVEKDEENCYLIDFDCINPQEWIEIIFYITGDPLAKINATGRIYGQEAEFNFINNDGKATTYERITHLIAALFITSNFPLLIIGLFWLFSQYSLNQFIYDFNSLPNLLEMILLLGIGGTTVILFAYLVSWFKRKQTPKGYILEEDYFPNPFQTIKIWWAIALTGKYYKVSNSAYSFGKIIVGNEIIDE